MEDGQAFREMENTNYFNEEYVRYWKERVGSNADGSKVADQQVADFYIRSLDILSSDKVLDLGCGHGRLYTTLSGYSKNIYGVDVTYDAINSATQYPYSALIKGSAEDTNVARQSFDKVISWGVFDVVDQEKGFVEVNRIMRKDGLFLVTGKNDNYDEDDALAFVAERNAKLKDFPNHFTDVSLLAANIERYGFKVVHAFAFKRRGDLGENKLIPLDPANISTTFYEFVLVLRKLKDIKDPEFSFCAEFSKTATAMSARHQFKNPVDFFKWHKQENP